MNEYIFYTSEGYTYGPRDDKEVENCQILCIASGKNIQEAKYKLEKECSWIKDCGFEFDNVIAKQLLTDENKIDIKKVIDYLIENEYDNYLKTERSENHIYNVLLRLNDMIM